MLAPKGFPRAHHSKTLGTRNEADAAETPQNWLDQLAQGLQLGHLAENDDVGVGPQAAEIHRLRDLPPLSRTGDVAHDGPARGPGLAQGLADPVHFSFTDKKINALHFLMFKEWVKLISVGGNEALDQGHVQRNTHDNIEGEGEP